jgi:hypothetical protein
MSRFEPIFRWNSLDSHLKFVSDHFLVANRNSLAIFGEYYSLIVVGVFKIVGVGLRGRNVSRGGRGRVVVWTGVRHGAEIFESGFGLSKKGSPFLQNYKHFFEKYFTI